MNKKKQISSKANPAWAFAIEQRYPWAFWELAFTPVECDSIMKYASQFKLEDAGINETTKDPAVRESQITWLYPDEPINFLFRRVTDLVIELNQKFIGFDLTGLIEGFQFTRYNSPTGHYSKHTDIVSNGPIRKLSITIQLTDPDEYAGGDLELFYSDTPTVANKRGQGDMILFPSWTMHRIAPVTQGTRHSLVGWVTGPAFK